MKKKFFSSILISVSMALVACATKPVSPVSELASPVTTTDAPSATSPQAGRDLALATTSNPKVIVGSPRILFVGNSLTGYNNLPGLVKAMGQSIGYSPYVEAFIHFNTSLDVPLADKKFRAELVSRNWDYVVIQEYSNLPVREPDEFIAHVADFAKILKGTKTKLLLFENWPYRASSPDAMNKLDKAYAAAVAAAPGVRVIYFGRAFNALKMSTNIELYAKDDIKHPSPIGSYLGALMFSQVMFNLAPRAAPHFGSLTNTSDVWAGAITAPPVVDLDKMYSTSVVTAIQDTAEIFR